MHQNTQNNLKYSRVLIAIMWVKVSMVLEHGIGDACYSNGVTP